MRLIEQADLLSERWIYRSELDLHSTGLRKGIQEHPSPCTPFPEAGSCEHHRTGPFGSVSTAVLTILRSHDAQDRVASGCDTASQRTVVAMTPLLIVTVTRRALYQRNLVFHSGSLTCQGYSIPPVVTSGYEGLDLPGGLSYVM